MAGLVVILNVSMVLPHRPIGATTPKQYNLVIVMKNIPQLRLGISSSIQTHDPSTATSTQPTKPSWIFLLTTKLTIVFPLLGRRTAQPPLLSPCLSEKTTSELPSGVTWGQVGGHLVGGQQELTLSTVCSFVHPVQSGSLWPQVGSTWSILFFFSPQDNTRPGVWFFQ